MRAALYGRYSTDRQLDRSVEDQYTLCEQYAARENLEIVARYSDRAQTGGTLHRRDGIATMLEAAARGEFKYIIVEALDRLSRDMEGLAAIHKRLTFAGVTIRAVHEGEVNTVLVGLRGLVGQLYREDNAAKIRRGLAGRVRDGRSAGGLAYGYRAVPGEPGRRVIDATEADVVRRIFTEYAAGRSPRDIARDLNTEGVAPPRGGRSWNASTINGSASRGYGIIRNDLYAGRLVWGRCRKVIHPETGRELIRANADTAAAADVPTLTIVTPELWEAAAKRRADVAAAPAHQHRRPKRLLSGLLRCGGCGGPLTVLNRGRDGNPRVCCARHKEGGTCPDPRSFAVAPIEAAVVRGIREHLLHPEAAAEFARALHEEQRQAAAETMRRRAQLERRLGEAETELSRVVDCIAKGWGDAAVLGPRSTALHHECEAARAELAAEVPQNIVQLHPPALAHYQTVIDGLERALEMDAAEHGGDACAALRSLIDAVTVWPGEAPGKFRLEITGKINELLREGINGAGRGDRSIPSRPALPPLPFMIRIAA